MRSDSHIRTRKRIDTHLHVHAHENAPTQVHMYVPAVQLSGYLASWLSSRVSSWAAMQLASYLADRSARNIAGAKKNQAPEICLAPSTVLAP